MRTRAKVVTFYLMVSLVITSIPLFSAAKVLAAEKKVDRNITGKYDSAMADKDNEIIKSAGGEYEDIDKTEACLENVSRILSAMDFKNMEKTAEILKEQEGVKSVELQRQYLDIVYETGVCQSVLVSTEADVLKQLRGAGMEEKDSTMYINGGLSDMRKKYAAYRTDDKCSTLFNRNILLWIPMDSRWGEHDEIDVMKQIVRAEDNLDLELTILRDGRATAESLKNLDKYGMVIFASHGANGEWLLTGEKYEPGKIPEETKKALLNQEQRIITLADENQIQDYYGITPVWFDKNISNNLPKTLIYNNTCGSMKTDAMWKVFEKKGASAYMGYSGSVRNEFAIFNLAMFFANFLDERESVFNSCPFFTDKYYTKEGAGVVPAGQGNYKIAREFEEPGMKPVMFPGVKDPKIRGVYINNEQESSKPSMIWSAAKGLKQAYGYINDEELHYISVGCAAILVGLNADKNEGLLKSIQDIVEEKSQEAWYALESEIMIMEGKNFYASTRIDEDDSIDGYFILEDTYEDYTISDLLYSVEEMYGSLPGLIIRLFFAAAGVAVMGANIRFK